MLWDYHQRARRRTLVPFYYLQEPAPPCKSLND